MLRTETSPGKPAHPRVEVQLSLSVFPEEAQAALSIHFYHSDLLSAAEV